MAGGPNLAAAKAAAMRGALDAAMNVERRSARVAGRGSLDLDGPRPQARRSQHLRPSWDQPQAPSAGALHLPHIAPEMQVRVEGSCKLD